MDAEPEFNQRARTPLVPPSSILRRLRGVFVRRSHPPRRSPSGVNRDPASYHAHASSSNVIPASARPATLPRSTAHAFDICTTTSGSIPVTSGPSVNRSLFSDSDDVAQDYRDSYLDSRRSIIRAVAHPATQEWSIGDAFDPSTTTSSSVAGASDPSVSRSILSDAVTQHHRDSLEQQHPSHHSSSGAQSRSVTSSVQAVTIDAPIAICSTIGATPTGPLTPSDVALDDVVSACEAFAVSRGTGLVSDRNLSLAVNDAQQNQTAPEKDSPGLACVQLRKQTRARSQSGVSVTETGGIGDIPLTTRTEAAPSLPAQLQRTPDSSGAEHALLGPLTLTGASLLDKTQMPAHAILQPDLSSRGGVVISSAGVAPGDKATGVSPQTNTDDRLASRRTASEERTRPESTVAMHLDGVAHAERNSTNADSAVSSLRTSSASAPLSRTSAYMAGETPASSASQEGADCSQTSNNKPAAVGASKPPWEGGTASYVAAAARDRDVNGPSKRVLRMLQGKWTDDDLKGDDLKRNRPLGSGLNKPPWQGGTACYATRARCFATKESESGGPTDKAGCSHITRAGADPPAFKRMPPAGSGGGSPAQPEGLVRRALRSVGDRIADWQEKRVWMRFARRSREGVERAGGVTEVVGESERERERESVSLMGEHV